MRWPWFRSRKRQEEPETEWWERLRRLEGDMQQLQLEWERMYAKVRQALASRGHTIAANGAGSFGGFQGILIDPRSGVLMGGSDPRKDGLAIGF